MIEPIYLQHLHLYEPYSHKHSFSEIFIASVVELNFDQSVYHVNEEVDSENQALYVCLTANSTDRPFRVTLTPVSGTAIGKCANYRFIRPMHGSIMLYVMQKETAIYYNEHSKIAQLQSDPTAFITNSFFLKETLILLKEIKQ